MAINNNLNDFFTDIADAIRSKKPYKPYLAPNGVRYNYHYSWDAVFLYNNCHCEWYSDYKIGTIKGEYAHYIWKYGSEWRLGICATDNPGSTIENMNYSYTGKGDCIVTTGNIGRQSILDIGYSSYMVQSITSDIPRFDDEASLREYLITPEFIPTPSSVKISPKDFASEILNL